MVVTENIANVFEHDPALLGGLAPDAAVSAKRRGLAEVMHCSRGNAALATPGGGFGLLVLDGFLCRVAEVMGRSSVEVLGRGDLLRPWEDDRAEAPVPVRSGHRVLAPATLAVLDRRFAQAVAPWPQVAETVCARFVERTHWLALQLALARVRRIDDRLHILLWHLADRWGRVQRDGTVLCSLPLTHEVLAAMIGAQRPTVSAALAQLTSDGYISRCRGGWVLHGGPPTDNDWESRALADAFRVRSGD